MHPNVPRGAGSQFARPHHPSAAPSRRTRPNSRARRGDPEQLKSEPWDLFLLVAAGLLLVGQARIHVFIPGAAALRPALLLGGLGLVLWVLQGDRIRSLKSLDTPLMKAGAFLAMWALVGIPFALWQGGAFSYFVGSFASTFTVFLLVAASIRSLEDVRRLMGVMALGTALYAFMAPSNPMSRAFGTGGYDPNDSAMFLASGIPILVFFALFGRKTWIRIASGVGTLLPIYAIIDTQSRGGFIALVAVLAFMILMLKGVRPALRATVVAVVVLASIPVATTDYWERMETIQELDDGYGETGIGGRRNIWARAMEYTMAHPVTGVGIDNFTVAEGRHPDIVQRIAAGRGAKYSVAHSVWFSTIAELGIPGFIGFVAMFFISLRELRKLQVRREATLPPKRATEVRVMAGVLIASLIGLMTAGSFLSNQYSVMVWGVLAIVAGLLKVSASAHRTHSPDSVWYPSRSGRAPAGVVMDRKPPPGLPGRTSGPAPHTARGLRG